ncbi:MAG: BatD family protein [Saprospiraceae bacterium]|nr:BatD family protein [Saprospiraceae bacterium]
MKKIIYTVCALFFTFSAAAQTPKFSVQVSSDTILLGNYFELKFTLENAASTKFEPPDLSAFDLIGGPNTSTSMSIVNGEVSQSASYTYYLEPPDLGIYTIPPAYVTIGDNVLETPPIDIVASPNPDGIIQRPHGPGKRFDQLFPLPEQNTNKSRRPRKKI